MLLRTLALGGLLALLPFAPGNAKSLKQGCMDHCASEYNFCLKRAITGQGRSECKKARQSCKHGCNSAPTRIRSAS